MLLAILSFVTFFTLIKIWFHESTQDLCKPVFMEYWWNHSISTHWQNTCKCLYTFKLPFSIVSVPTTTTSTYFRFKHTVSLFNAYHFHNSILLFSLYNKNTRNEVRFCKKSLYSGIAFSLRFLKTELDLLHLF